MSGRGPFVGESPEGGAVTAPTADGDDLRARATAGVMWAAAEKWTVRASTLVGFILLGRLLGPTEFGIVALAMVFITVLTVFTDGGLTLYLIQSRTMDRTIASTAFFISGAAGLVLAPALALAAPALARLLDAPTLAQILPALSLSLLIGAFSNVPASLLQREMRFRVLATRQVVATTVSVVVAVVLAVSGAGVWALVAQTLVRSVISFGMLWGSTDFRPAWAFSGPAAREMSAFGSKNIGVELLRRARTEGEVLLIGVLAGTTALGLWTVALRLADVVLDLCTSAFGRVAHPVFARLQDDSPRLGRALSTAMALGALVMVPMLMLLSLVSEAVVPIVFGPQWLPAAGVAAILAIRTLVTGLGDFHRSVLLATGKAGAELVITFVQVAVQAVIIVVFADDGLTTLAFALTAWAVISWPIRALVVWRIHGIGARAYTQTALIVIAAGFAVAVVLGVNQLAELEGWGFVALAVLLGALAYVGAVFLVGRGTVGEAWAALPAKLRNRVQRRRG